MSKANPKTGAEVTRFAQDQGFRFVRQTGSHATYEHDDGRRVTICQGHHGDIPNGTLRAIMKVLIKAAPLIILLGILFWNALDPHSLQVAAYNLWNLTFGGV